MLLMNALRNGITIDHILQLTIFITLQVKVTIRKALI